MKVLMQVSFEKFSKFGLFNISAKANRPILLYFFEGCLPQIPKFQKILQKNVRSKVHASSNCKSRYFKKVAFV